MKDKLVTVFGGSGFLGRYVVQKLTKEGALVRVAVRNPDQALFLKTMGQVGQVTPIQVDIRSEQSIDRAISDSDYVVNLIGILFEKRRNTFESAHVLAARNIAAVAHKNKVKRLVHISAIGADPSAHSKYASTKGKGEAEVLKTFSTATILRPSIMFGEEDKFFNMFACLARFSPILPLIAGGNTLLQPVYVADVAKAIYQVLSEQKGGQNPHARKIYELGGPTTYKFRDILHYVLKVTGRKRWLAPIPFPVATLISYFTQLLPTPLLTPDQVRLLRQDNIVSQGALTFKDLGIEPTSVEFIVPLYLKRYRYYG